MNDGKTLYQCFGGIKDFVLLPSEYAPSDILGFESGWGSKQRKNAGVSPPSFKWCLYDERKETLKRVDFGQYPFSSLQLLRDQRDKYFPL